MLQLHSIAAPEGTWLVLIGWLYLLTNAVRVFTYIPQIVTVWRCHDGARSVSLLTWNSWVVSHVAALGYGVLVIQDGLFVAITLVNLVGCGAVAAIAARRRAQWRRWSTAEARSLMTPAPQDKMHDANRAPARRVAGCLPSGSEPR